MKLFLFCLAVLFSASRCNRGECEPEDTQCNGGVVEVCNADGAWMPWVDCSAVETMDGSTLVCCLDRDDGLNGCVPESECEVEE